jgi:hypothetical protein
MSINRFSSTLYGMNLVEDVVMPAVDSCALRDLDSSSRLQERRLLGCGWVLIIGLLPLIAALNCQAHNPLAANHPGSGFSSVPSTSLADLRAAKIGAYA